MVIECYAHNFYGFKTKLQSLLNKDREFSLPL